MTTFNEIIGYDSIKEELYQIIDMFKNSELYEKTNATLPKGVLIYGIPGVGKTMLAEAFINECGVKSYTIRMNNTKDKVISDIKEAFEKAKDGKKAIIFIDDIDKFSDTNASEVDDECFILIQSCIDEVKNNEVLVIATANTPRKLPESLKRNGRFDRKIQILTPSREDSKKIVEYYLKKKNVNEDINASDVANMISYTSCADLQTIINESAISATYKRKEKIEIDDIVNAYLKDKYHSPDAAYKRTDDELENAIYHEAGHAVASEILMEGSVGIVSIQYSGRNFGDGITTYCKQVKKRSETIVRCLAGKVAVETFYSGRCGSGCSSDLELATNSIKHGIMYNGTNGISLVKVDDKNSNEYLHNLEVAVHANMERYLFATKELLVKNKEFLFAVVEKLREKKYLLQSDIQNIRKNVTVVSYEIHC